MNDQHRLKQEYAQAGVRFRSFSYSIGSSPVTSTQEEDTANDEPQPVVRNIRKLFKLGKAQNVPRGAPGLRFPR